MTPTISVPTRGSRADLPDAAALAGLCVSGGPGRSLSPAYHRSGLAGLPHPVVSGNSIALRRKELHRPLKCQRFGQMAADFPLNLLLVTFAGFVNRDQSRLIAEHHTYPHKKRVGRPAIMNAIRELIVRMATENAGWGYLRIRGELKKVGHRVAKTTIATTLKNNGIAPSPDRPTTWSTFLKSHADVIGAADFFTVDVWTKRGLVTHYVFFVIHHATRMVEIAGITPNPNSAFMAQVARNLTDQVDGFLRDMKHLILDNDALYTKQFVRILKDTVTKVVHTAIQAPNMNSLAERWVLTAKSECLSKMILFGEQHLRRTLNELVAH
ncbi:MAG: transposase InsO family protein, partial [Planctomycetota bacterium]